MRMFKTDKAKKIEDTIRVKYERDGKTFEILVKPDEYEDYRKGKLQDINQILFTSEIFKDISTAERPTSEDLVDIFKTDDHSEITQIILNKGEFQLTTEQRNKMKEEKRNRIVSQIARLAKDPRTNAPHPASRIENALHEAKINIDPMKSIDDQMKDIVEKLKKVLPLSFEKKTIAIKIPVAHGGKCYGIVNELSDIRQEDWQPSFLFLKVEVPAGIQAELMEKLGKITHGEAEFVDVK